MNTANYMEVLDKRQQDLKEVGELVETTRNDPSYVAPSNTVAQAEMPNVYMSSSPNKYGYGYEKTDDESTDEMGYLEALQAGFNTSVIGTEIRKAYTNKGQYFGPTVSPSDEDLKKVIKATGYDPVMTKAVFRGLTDIDDLDNHLKVIKENQKINAELSKLGFFKSLVASGGTAMGNPIDLATMFVTGGASWTTRAVFSGVAGAVSGQVLEDYTGVESDIVMDALAGAALCTIFDGAFHRSTFRKTSDLAVQVADAIDKNAGIDPNRVNGKSKVAATINRTRERIERAMPTAFISGETDNLITAVGIATRDKLIKSQKGLQRIDPNTGAVTDPTHKVYGSSEATAEEIRDSLNSQYLIVRDNVAQGFANLRALGVSDEQANRAVEEFVQTGQITNISDPEAIKIATDISSEIRDFYDSRLSLLKETGLLPEGFENYIPFSTNEDSVLRLMANPKVVGDAKTPEERMSRTIDYISKTLIEGVNNDPKARKRLYDFYAKEEQARIAKINEGITRENAKRQAELDFHSKQVQRGEKFHEDTVDAYLADLDKSVDSLDETRTDDLIDQASLGYDTLKNLEDNTIKQSQEAKDRIEQKYADKLKRFSDRIDSINKKQAKADADATTRYSKTEDQWFEYFKKKKNKTIDRIRNEISTWKGLYENKALAKLWQGFEGALNDPKSTKAVINKARKRYEVAVKDHGLKLKDNVQKLKDQGRPKTEIDRAQKTADDFAIAHSSYMKAINDLDVYMEGQRVKAKKALKDQNSSLKDAISKNKEDADLERARVNEEFDTYTKSNPDKLKQQELKKADDDFQAILGKIQQRRARLDNSVGRAINKISTDTNKAKLRAVRKGQSLRKRASNYDAKAWARLNRHYKPKELLDPKVEINDQKFAEWLPEQTRQTARGWLSVGEAPTHNGKNRSPLGNKNYRKTRVPMPTSYENADGFRCDDMRTDVLESLDRYSRRSAGDIAVKKTLGVDGYDEAQAHMDQVLAEEISARPDVYGSQSKRDNLERALRQTIDRIYGTSGRENDRNLSWLKAVGEVVRNLTFATSNTYMGILNHTETSMMLQAQGAKALLTQIPGFRKYLGRFGNNGFDADTMRIVHDLSFGRELSTLNIWGDVRKRNRQRYANSWVADIVAGTEWVANALPTTKYLQHSQKSIVECAQDAMLSELIHRNANVSARSKWLKNKDVVLNRLSITNSQFNNLNKALSEAFEVTKDGAISIKDIDKLKTNREAMLTLRRLGDYVADESILRTGIADNFLFADSQNELLNLLLQFKTFALRSYNNRLVKSMNRWEDGHGQAEMLNHIISLGLATVGNIGIAYARTAGMAEEDRKKYLENTLGFSDIDDIMEHLDDVIWLGLNRSSIYAAPALVANMAGFGTSAKTTASTVDAFAYTDEEGRQLSDRFTPKTFTDMFPSARKVLATLNLPLSTYDYLSANAFEDDEWTARQRYLAHKRIYLDLKTLMPNWGYPTNFLYENIKPNKDNYY